MQASEPIAGGGPVRTALVLAAGLGTRLAHWTGDRPKCLVSVGGATILERLVVALDAHGIERLVVVIGYRGEMIRDHLGDSFGGVAVEYIESPLFATTNTMYSLWLARDLIDEPVLLAESDVIFPCDLLAPLLEPDRIAVSRQLPWMSGSTVTLDPAGYVNALYSPPPGIYFQHCTSPDHLITVNVCSLAAATWRDVGERLDRHVAAGHTGYFHDVVFADMIAEGSMALAAVLFPANRWYEVDTPADREAAELVVAGFPPTAVRGSERSASGGTR